MPKCKVIVYATTDALPDAESEVRTVLRSLRFDDFELETVDVQQDALRAKRDGVTTTPLVVITDSKGTVRKFPSLAKTDPYDLKYALGLNRLW